MRLKIEINTREHFAVVGLANKSFEVKSQWFSKQAMLPTFHLEELLATKLRALYQRKKGRDLFDLVVVLKKFPELAVEKMLQVFIQYMRFDQRKISRAEFEANLEEKLSDEAFLNDIFPLLPAASVIAGVNSSSLTLGSNEDIYNPLNDIVSVQKQIIGRLPGESWKGRRSET